MKILTQLYTVLKARLTEVENVKKVDWFNDQYRHTDDESATRYPVVYVEFLDPIPWVQSGDKWQHGRATVKLHCVVYDVKNSPERAIEFSQKVFEQLNSKGLYDNENNQLSTELVRSSTTFPKRYNQLKVATINFDCEIFDASNMPLVEDASPVQFTIVPAS